MGKSILIIFFVLFNQLLHAQNATSYTWTNGDVYASRLKESLKDKNLCGSGNRRTKKRVKTTVNTFLEKHLRYDSEKAYLVFADFEEFVDSKLFGYGKAVYQDKNWIVCVESIGSGIIRSTVYVFSKNNQSKLVLFGVVDGEPFTSDALSYSYCIDNNCLYAQKEGNEMIAISMML